VDARAPAIWTARCSSPRTRRRAAERAQRRRHAWLDHVQEGISAAAIALFKEAIEGYPEGHPLRGTVRYHLAKAYDKNGERDRAVAELKRALDEVAQFNERADAEKLLKQLQTG